MRTLLLMLSTVFLFAACAPSNADTPAPKATELAGKTEQLKAAAATAPNIVCERFKLVNDKAECKPEYTGVGDHHTHSATVKVGNSITSCVINDASLTVVCGDAISFVEPAPAPAQTAKPSSKK